MSRKEFVSLHIKGEIVPIKTLVRYPHTMESENVINLLQKGEVKLEK